MKRLTLITMLIIASFVVVSWFDGEEPVRQPIPAFDAKECRPSDQVAPNAVLALAALSIAEPEALEAVDELGVDTVRVEFRWDHIEPGRMEYDWQRFDGVVSALRDRDIDIIATINHPPVWAHDVNDLSPEFARFLGDFLERYQDEVLVYEIFNEPNLPGYGWPFGTGSTTYDAGMYASVLVEANRAIRTLDSSALIMIGGLSPSGEPLEYIDALYAHGIGDCYDIFSYHPYGQAERLIEVQSELESILAGYGDETKPVWFGEFGTSDDELRADILAAVERQLPELDGMVWFSLRDLKRFGWDFGLMEYDWTKKDDFERFERLVETHKEIQHDER